VSQTLFRESGEAFKRVLAGQMGCPPEAYESHSLTVCERPPTSREPHPVLLTTCGTGTVVSVKDARLGDWVRVQALEFHFRVFLPSFLEGLAGQARELGYEGARSHSASTGMVLAEERLLPALAPDCAIRELSVEEQGELRATGEFDNALAEPGESRKIASFRTAFALETEGRLAAVSGVWDQYPGIDEIGVDVVRDFRGKGFGSAVTIQAVRWIRARGRWPMYTYGFTNVRSANNGLASGFRPLWFISAVYVPEDH